MSSVPPDPPARGVRHPVRVLASRLESAHVTSFVLQPVGGGDLPPWQAGAHVDLHLPSGTVRQYSLCGDPADRSEYRIAVLELAEGRGGSREAHRELRPGVQISVGAPRPDFTLIDAERYVFVAGGIGITPLLPMIREVNGRGADWQLMYGARSQGHVTFRDELLALGPDRVSFVTEADGDILEPTEIARASAGAAVYCCGPAGLMDALADAMAAEGRSDDLHLERFTATTPPVDVGEGFEVELARSGLVVPVPPDQSVLEAVRGAGVDHPSSCEMGICGTCETKVLAGQVDHRDDLLTDDEKTAGCTMMLCVSRAACTRLVLDL